MDSYFASPQRSDIQMLNTSAEAIITDNHLTLILDSFPSICTIVDWNRQIVYANKELLNVIGLNNLNELLGKRPGEALNCPHSKETKGGCGTSESCRYCGLVNAILTCLEKHEPVRSECTLNATLNGSKTVLELMVLASPVIIKDNIYVIVFLNDISGERRRNALERLFFHDILNRIGALKGFTELVLMLDEMDQIKDIAKDLNELSDEITEEILAHRDLLMAENKTYHVNVFPIKPNDLFNTVKKQMIKHQVAIDKKIEINESVCQDIIATDLVMLKRVLINLVKNALEAIGIGERVLLDCKCNDDEFIFSVNNTSVMPRSVQLQLFQRAFSTKAKDRGIGTYSVKMFTEDYLKGKISFISNENEGTTFFVTLPKSIDE